MMHDWLRFVGVAIVLLAVGAFIYPLYETALKRYRIHRQGGASPILAIQTCLAEIPAWLKRM